MAITLKKIVSSTASYNELSEMKAHILAAAKEAAEANRVDKLVVEFSQGYHYLSEPLTLSAEENPELASLELTLRATYAGTTTLTSWGRVMGDQFTPAEGMEGVYAYTFPKDENGKFPLFRDLFVNGSRIRMSRSVSWKNPDPFIPEERRGEVKRAGLYAPIEIVRKLAEGTVGATELMMYVEWEYCTLHVLGADLSNTKEVNGETYALITFREGEMDYFCEKSVNHLNVGNRKTFFMNTPAFLTEPGTFAYDYYNGTIYVCLPEGVSPSRFAVEYPLLDTLLSLDGLKNATVEGLNFIAAGSAYVCENPIWIGQANNIRNIGRLKCAAILARNMRGFTVDGCRFEALGVNGVQVYDQSVGTTVKNCVFRDVGMCGVTIGNPANRWEEEKNRTFAARVENNYFNHIAYDAPAAPCIYLAQVDGVKLLHNTVEDCAYSAVSIGWTWVPANFELGERVNIRGAELAYNYFHNYMQLLKDGGAIYVLGGNANRVTTPERFNRMHDNFALLDSRKNEYGKYGYYCDGSASNWEVSHSVVLNNEMMPIFSQPYPGALSYHNHFTEIYSNTTPHISTHVPPRDIIRENYVYDNLTPEEYLAKYPEAKRIADAAGCKNLI